MLADWKSAQCENKEPSLQSTSQIAKGTRIRTLLRNLQFDENHWRSRKPEWWKWWDYRLGPNLPHNARESHPVSNLHSDLSFHSWFINGYNYLQNHSGKGFFQRFCKALAKGSLAVCIFFHLRKCAQDLRCILFSWELLKWCIRKVSELLGWNIRTAEPEPLFGFTQNLNLNDGRS